MAKKVQYTNAKGNVYFVHSVDGKRGKRFVCSQKESAEDLTSLPDGFEFYENPNGQVSCRRKSVSLIEPEEMALASRLVPKLAAPDLVKCELKKKEIVIHSHAGFPDLGSFMPYLNKSEHEVTSVFAKFVRYQAVLKFELTNPHTREFAVYRMTWRGNCDWTYLSSGSLSELIAEYAPHIEKESFFELY